MSLADSGYVSGEDKGSSFQAGVVAGTTVESGVLRNCKEVSICARLINCKVRWIDQGQLDGVRSQSHSACYMMGSSSAFYSFFFPCVSHFLLFSAQ